MENKINRGELFSLCAILLYGSFASTKYALTMGELALPLTAAALAFELVMLLLISVLPAVSSPMLGFVLSLAPLCALAARAYGGARALNGSEFSYIPFWVLAVSSLLLCAFLASRKISAAGRLAIIVLIITVITLVVLVSVYAKDLDRSRISSGYSDFDGAAALILSSLPELFAVYLAKSFFACEENDRAAKPPLERPLSRKERRKLFRRLTLLAFAAASALRLGVSTALLSLAHPRLYKLSENTSTFAARLLRGVNISPLISIGVYALTLLSFAFSLSLTAQFSREIEKRGN